MFAHARVPAASPRATWRRSPARSSRAGVRASIAEPSSPAAAAKAGDKQTAIVVGGGVGGLGMASRLAHAGYDVTILEKNLDTGGRCRSESFDGKGEGYRFDTGPSLMLLPDRYREQFTAVGKNLHDYMDIKRVDPAYRAHFGDHTSLDLLYDTERMRAQLDAVEEGAGGRYIDWLGRARASLDYGVAAFIEKDANSILDFVDLRRVGPLALAVNPIDLLLPQFNQMAKYFKNEKLRALFSYQELYVGLSPYNAPGVFSLLAATELTDGVWYPVGGFDKVRQSLQQLADEEGVVTRLGAEVAQIVTTPLAEGEASPIAGSKATQKVTGVRLENGEVLSADVVVANPDLPCVWDQMIDHATFPEAKKEAERWEDADYSCSVIEFNWCLGRDGARPAAPQRVLIWGLQGLVGKARLRRGLRRSQAAQLLLPQPRVHGPQLRPGRGRQRDGAPPGGEHQRAAQGVRQARRAGAQRGGDGERRARGCASSLQRSGEGYLEKHRLRVRDHAQPVAGAVQHQARRGVRAVARPDAARGVSAAGADGHPAAGLAGG